MERLTYKANEGMTYKRKVDGHIMGNELYLGLFIDGSEDTIDNYVEVELPEPFKRLIDKFNEIKNKRKE